MKCFYHSSDLDGHCSGAIIKQKFPECQMIGINYGDKFPWDTIEKDEMVFMVDFGLQPFSDMERLNSICKFVWIDHHKTAIDEAHEKGFMASGQLLEVGRAGCELTWDYIHGNYSMPETVRLLGRYDVWDHSDTYTLPFQYGMRMVNDTYPTNQDFWNTMLTHNNHVNSYVQTGKLIIQYEKQQNTKFCEAFAFETVLNGFHGICANRGFTNSQLFDSVYNPERHHLMITFSRLKPPADMWTVSLYSTRDDVDCGAIAKQFCGGGHKGAAGFQCKNLPFPI